MKDRKFTTAKNKTIEPETMPMEHNLKENIIDLVKSAELVANYILLDFIYKLLVRRMRH